MAPLLICWPQGQGAERTQAEFHSAQHIHGVMGAIDGCHIPIAAPNEAPETYLNRKNFIPLFYNQSATGTCYLRMRIVAGLALCMMPEYSKTVP